jgi:sugar-specific transcriptional regulator TrmB
MTKEKFLERVGLTKNEIKVYLSLLKIGQTTTSKIIKDIGINTSKVYESLDRLLKKGLVSYTIIKNKKNWNAENPEKINEFLEEEKNNIEKKQEESKMIVKELLTIANKKSNESKYKIYEGINGIKTARENILNVLKRGDTFHLILSSFHGDNKLNAYFADFQKRRAKLGINYKAIFNNELKKEAEKMQKLKNSEVKFINPESLSPTWTEIYDDYVAIGVMGENPSIFVIKNKDVAKGFLNYFEGLWKISKNNKT